MLFAIFFVVLAASSPTDTKTCYRLNGKPSRHYKGKADVVPCNRTAEVSSCCSEADMCMGNGLCLNMVANNKFSLQGCTDPSWPEACGGQFKLPSTKSYAYAWPCGSGYLTPYCLGHEDAACCNDEKNLVYLPRFKNIHQAGDWSYGSPGETDHVGNRQQRSGSAAENASLNIGIVGTIGTFLGVIVAILSLILVYRQRKPLRHLPTRMNEWWKRRHLKIRKKHEDVQHELDIREPLARYSDLPVTDGAQNYNAMELPA